MLMSEHKDSSDISDEERALFRNQMTDVEAIHHTPKHVPDQCMPSTRPRSREADDAAVMLELFDDDPERMETGEDLYFARDGIQTRVMRRLRRGHYRCQAYLDLHGSFVDTARKQVARFLYESCNSGHRCVRIVHGKGLRSGNRGPVLRDKVAGWLRQRDEVLAYCSAAPKDGGTGAVYVLLHRR